MDIIQNAATTDGKSISPARANKYLDFDVDRACETPDVVPATRRKASSLRHWTPHDRDRLQRLMGKGYKADEIGRRLGRTPNAISQQWRKQKISGPGGPQHRDTPGKVKTLYFPTHSKLTIGAHRLHITFSDEPYDPIDNEINTRHRRDVSYSPVGHIHSSNITTCRTT